MSERVPVDTFPPGEFIREELEERGWTQEVLAAVLGTTLRHVNEIITAKRGITPETAKALGEAFDTGAQVWMNLESTYRLSLVRVRDNEIARRAKLYSVAPVKEMIRRRWIEPSESLDVLEERLKRFFGGLRSLDETPSLRAAARKTKDSDADYSVPTPSQTAWLYRAKQMAMAVHAERFSKASIAKALKLLRPMLANPEDVRLVPMVLADAGIRFVIVKHLTGAKIDGSCFWLDKSSPVIALSMRFDRIDWFWFTLLHEIRHVLNEDGLVNEIPVDSQLVGEGATRTDEKSEVEQDADRFAVEFAIDQAALTSLISRIHPLYSRKNLEGFAAVQAVHPGVVVGQLQYLGKLGYSHHRQMLVPVREIVTASALTDGWGDQAPPLS